MEMVSIVIIAVVVALDPYSVKARLLISPVFS
jgi:hypothetical protein